MKKSILNLGKILPKKSQQLIFGGNNHNECGYGTCGGGASCYDGGNGTFCSEKDPGINALPVPEPDKPSIQKMPRIVTSR